MSALRSAMSVKALLDREDRSAPALTREQSEACWRIFHDHHWGMNAVEELDGTWDRDSCGERIVELDWLHGILCSLEDEQETPGAFLGRDDLEQIARLVKGTQASLRSPTNRSPLASDEADLRACETVLRVLSHGADPATA
ncbi:MAG: hypothetical protein REI11_04590 [Patulibacter sp.]|nr:hypothetical protein [Patulibacter sp.]